MKFGTINGCLSKIACAQQAAMAKAYRHAVEITRSITGGFNTPYVIETKLEEAADAIEKELL